MQCGRGVVCRKAWSWGGSTAPVHRGARSVRQLRVSRGANGDQHAGNSPECVQYPGRTEQQQRHTLHVSLVRLENRAGKGPFEATTSCSVSMPRINDPLKVLTQSTWIGDCISSTPNMNRVETTTQRPTLEECLACGWYRRLGPMDAMFGSCRRGPKSGVRLSSWVPGVCLRTATAAFKPVALRSQLQPRWPISEVTTSVPEGQKMRPIHRSRDSEGARAEGRACSFQRHPMAPFPLPPSPHRLHLQD